MPEETVNVIREINNDFHYYFLCIGAYMRRRLKLIAGVADRTVTELFLLQ